jgi:hypothetical protein
MNRPFRIQLLALIPLLQGCGPGKDEHAGHDHGPAHKHEHRAPHGGTAVVLGNEAFHLEFVRDAASGTLTCFVLDAHMENFVRIAAASVALEAELENGKQSLGLAAVANAATGEKVGDSSQFESKADWVRNAAKFSGRIPEIEIRGTKFTDVRFRFPEGNE